jgi:hypothetical protein
MCAHFSAKAGSMGLILVMAAVAAAAQSTIFNIPTADTLGRGSWNLEADLITKPVSYRDGGYQTYGYRVAYGLTRRTEIGSNFYLTYDGSRSVAQAEFSVKQLLYENERHGVKVSAGTIVVVPLRSRGADKTSEIVYAAASKTVEPLNGLTVTGGTYHVFGGRNFGTRTGALLGLTQPVTRRVSFVADWFSGKNRLGYATAGAGFNVTKRQYFLTGYSFGNSGRGNNALAAYYGITF